jgi:hypothetical protein
LISSIESKESGVKTLFSSLKLKLRQIVTVTLASLLLLISTACSNPADTQAANPQNQPVQMGGMNNPSKNGGDRYTENKTGGKKISLTDSQQLIAATQAELLYPGAETPQGRAKKEAEMPIITEKSFKPKPGGTIQRQSDVGERFKDRVETVKESVEEASAFLKDKADEASARPELQKNPAVGR